MVFPRFQYSVVDDSGFNRGFGTERILVVVSTIRWRCFQMNDCSITGQFHCQVRIHILPEGVGRSRPVSQTVNRTAIAQSDCRASLFEYQSFDLTLNVKDGPLGGATSGVV